MWGGGKTGICITQNPGKLTGKGNIRDIGDHRGVVLNSTTGCALERRAFASSCDFVTTSNWVKKEKDGKVTCVYAAIELE